MKKKVIALVLTACMVPVVSVGSGVDVMAAKGDSGDKITLNCRAMIAMTNIRKLSKLLKRKIRILKSILKKYPIMQLKF